MLSFKGGFQSIEGHRRW